MPFNRRLAHPLPPAALLACAALAWPAASSAATSCPDSNTLPTHTTLTKARTATLCLINNERTSRGLAALHPNSKLQEVAHSYSRLIVRQRFFSHVSRSGSTLTSRVRDQSSYLRGSHSWGLRENIAWGSGILGTPAHTVAAWMASAGHRANILAPGFHDLGLGITTGAPAPTHGLSAATYTADFGRR